MRKLVPIIIISILTLISQVMANSPSDSTIRMPYLQSELDRSYQSSRFSIGFGLDQDRYNIKTVLSNNEESERDIIYGYGLYLKWSIKKDLHLFGEATGTRLYVPIIPTRLAIQYDIFESDELKLSIQSGIGLWNSEFNHSIGVLLALYSYSSKFIPFIGLQVTKELIQIQEANNNQHVLFHEIVREKLSLLAGIEFKQKLKNISVQYQSFTGLTKSNFSKSELSVDNVLSNKVEDSGAILGFRIAFAL